MTYGEVGRGKIRSIIDNRMIQYWARIINSKNYKLSKLMYSLLLKMHDNNVYKSKWLSKIKEIMDNNGFSFLWGQSQVNSRWLKNALSQRIKDGEMQTWQSEVNNNRFCNSYRLFKQTLSFEPYLSKLEYIERINLAKFRCGCHKLPISVNKYVDSDDPKLCTLCDRNEQGDEYHYVLVCPKFMDERKRYLKRYYHDRPSTVKMNLLFNSRNVKVLSNLAKFFRIIMASFT